MVADVANECTTEVSGADGTEAAETEANATAAAVIQSYARTLAVRRQCAMAQRASVQLQATARRHLAVRRYLAVKLRLEAGRRSSLVWVPQPDRATMETTYYL